MYPEEKIGFYKKQLRRTFQTNYRTIKEYYDELKDLAGKQKEKKNHEKKIFSKVFGQLKRNYTLKKSFTRQTFTENCVFPYKMHSCFDILFA